MADIGRRGFFALTGTALFSGNLQLAFGASDFWNKKDPANWSSDDVRTLITKSPWAKDVAVISRAAAREAIPGSAPAGSGLPGDPGIGQGPARPRMDIPITSGADASDPGDGRRGAAITAPAVTVRWESAQPLRDAFKNTIPRAFDGHYAIAVSGFQTPGADRAEMLERLKIGASLQAKGKERVQAGLAQYSKDPTVVLFGFSRDLLPLTAADKDVLFTINTDEVSLRAKFDPKEMIYRGNLAI